MNNMIRDFVQNIRVFSSIDWDDCHKYLKKISFEQKQKKDEVKKVATCCKACIANCSVIATVKNGRVVKLQGDPSDPMNKGRMCAKGLSGIQALYNPNRNKYPMLRVGKRGENRWRRITWDEALEITAKKLIETKEKYGAESLVCSTGGGGNPELWSIARFCNIFGSPNWFEPGCAQCYLPRVVAYKLMYGGPDGSIADLKSLDFYFPKDTQVKTLVLWGTGPSYSSPACGGGMLADLREKGVYTISVDPRLTPDSAKSDIWLPIRPGTDVALMLAWIRYIIAHKLYDEEFVLKWTNLPYLVDVETKMLLRAEHSTDQNYPDTFMVWDNNTQMAVPLQYPWNDTLDAALDKTCYISGKECKTGFTLLKERVDEYTLEHAAEICWLDAKQIEKAIRLYAENTPGGLVLGVATDQSPNSVQAAMASAILNMIVGNVEKPGASLQRFKTSGTFDKPGNPVPPTASKLPDEQLKKRLGGTEYKGLHFWLAAHPPAILESMLTGKPYPVKVWIDRSGNKLGAVANTAKWVEAMERLDFIVHMFTYPTSFSAYADILFPAEEWLETNMMLESCNQLRVRQQVVHLWETMDETLFWSRLAKKCADLGDAECQKAFDPEYMGNDLPYWDSEKELFDHFLARVGVTFDELAKNGPMEFASLDEWRQYFVYQQTDKKTGLPRGFDTPSKKAELYAESMITLGRTGKPFSKCELPPASKDYDPLPYYMEPEESPIRKSEISEQYPLVLTSGRIPLFHHGTLRNVPWLRELYPVPEVWIHPVDSERYGVSHGDWVWVESQRGKIRGKAHVTRGIKQGVVYMERFWNPETLNTKTHGWKEMNVNVLTRSEGPYNDVMGTYTLRGFLVRIRKADQAPEGVWTKPEDFKSWLPQASEPTNPVIEVS